MEFTYSIENVSFLENKLKECIKWERNYYSDLLSKHGALLFHDTVSSREIFILKQLINNQEKIEEMISHIKKGITVTMTYEEYDELFYRLLTIKYG
ncbi:hypothetical protein [Pseudalkalibacillus caeni]|uniref:Uncharacterized protein n=1 Tax=Exobacillus caeni TaxID=2574798 RepID=A0A5R9EXS3_9BACL|nr:hypothetical protein [Pseudalkalibacillus caeni]TLS35661.1 hypothetical protein FCL54_19365 [Pseudalkalibacillus caeni]